MIEVMQVAEDSATPNAPLSQRTPLIRGKADQRGGSRMRFAKITAQCVTSSPQPQKIATPSMNCKVVINDHEYSFTISSIHTDLY